MKRWLMGAIGGALLVAGTFVGASAAGGQEVGPPVLVFPFPASQQYRITCGYALPQTAAIPFAARQSDAAAEATKPEGCGHSGEPYNRYALDLQHAGGNKAAWRQPVLASASGAVSSAGWHDSLGWHVIIDHGGGYQTVYGHLVGKPRVAVGQNVEQGTVLGRVGSTGSSTGPHIHFVLWKDGVSVNPEPICGLRRLTYGMIVSGCTEAPLIVPSDFDGDGSADIVLLTEAVNGAAHIKRVDFDRERLRPMAHTTFWPREGEQLERVTHTLSGDFDGDGLLDVALVLAGPYCWSKVDVVAGGEISLASRKAWWSDGTYCSRNAVRAASGDFDGDALADIALLYEVAPGETRIDVLHSDGKRFAPPETWWFSEGYFADRAVHLASGDFDADGVADLAALYNYGGCETRAHVFLSTRAAFEYDGPGGWWRDEQTCAGQIAGAATGDIDGDGVYDDLALLFELPGGRTSIDVLTADGGRFVEETLWSSRGGAVRGERFLVAGDFAGDAATDLAIVHHADCSTSVEVLAGEVGTGQPSAVARAITGLEPDVIRMRNSSCPAVRDALP